MNIKLAVLDMVSSGEYHQIVECAERAGYAIINPRPYPYHPPVLWITINEIDQIKTLKRQFPEQEILIMVHPSVPSLEFLEIDCIAARKRYIILNTGPWEESVCNCGGGRYCGMGRRKKSRTEASSSGPMVEDAADIFPLAMEEEGLHHDPPVGASSSRAGASSKKKKKSAFSAIPDEYSEIPDTPLLKELGKHLSAFCRSQMTSPISGWRCTWQLAIKAFQKASPDLRAEIEVVGFGSFLTIPHIQCDRRLIKGLCERWFGETNTFHLPCCEFGITPMNFVIKELSPIHCTFLFFLVEW